MRDSSVIVESSLAVLQYFRN